MGDPFVQPTKTPGEKVIEAGKTLQKTETEYITAIKVQNLRDLAVVEKNALWQARKLGALAQYAIPYKTKTCPACNYKAPHAPEAGSPCPKCGEKMVNIVKGGTVKLAKMLAGCWGNIAWDIPIVSYNSQQWIVNVKVIDLETGVNSNEEIPILKPKYGDNQREVEKTFRQATARALRNGIYNVVPPWLVEDSITEALQSSKEAIVKIGIKKAAGKIFRGLGGLGVPQRVALESIGLKSIGEIEDDNDEHAELIAGLNSKWAALKSGEEDAQSLFPEVTPPAEPDAKAKDKTAKDLFGKEGEK